MRITFLATAALASVAALVVPAAAAEPDVFVGGTVGPLVRYDNDMEGWAATAGIQYNLTPTLGVQGELVVQHAIYPVITDVSISDFDGAVHLFHREGDQFLAGGFAQVGRTTFNSKGGPTEFDRLIAGLEGQVYVDQLTLYGQAGVIRQHYPNLPEFSATGLFATAEARYFVTPNFKLDVHGGISVMASDSATLAGREASNFNLGLGAEYRFDNTPLSIFGRIGAHRHQSSYSDTATRVQIGLKGSFGTETLLDRDRRGATLKPVDSEFALSPSPD